MSKQVLIISGVVIVIILIIGGLILAQQNKPAVNEQAAVNTQPDQPTPSPAPSKGTIQSLLTSSKNVTCEITYPEQNTKGNIFVSGGKFRGDFEVSVDNKPILSHMIHSDGYAYIWTEGSTQGTKIKIDPSQVATQSGQNQTADLNKEVDLNCNSWTVDNSKFAVPTTIKFTDLSQTLKNLPSQGTTPKIGSSVCDQISDPKSKASCIKALGN